MREPTMKLTRRILMAAAAGRGGELMQELRERERGDLMAGAYPRVKTHDDATFLVIAAGPQG